MCIRDRPATLTASGLAILAALPAAQVRALFPSRGSFVERHGVGPCSLGQLRRELTDTRSRGYAVEDGLVTPGLASVAVAVLDHSGHPVAGVAVTYPTEAGRAGRTPGGIEVEQIVAQVRHTAEGLSERLGHRSHT